MTKDSIEAGERPCVLCHEYRSAHLEDNGELICRPSGWRFTNAARAAPVADITGAMLERVARAIYAANPLMYKQRAVSWIGATPARRAHSMNQARAAYTAMREIDPSFVAMRGALESMLNREHARYDDSERAQEFFRKNNEKELAALAQAKGDAG